LADALEVPVIAGPYEATAQGNALMQLVGLGELHNLEEVRASAGRAAWDEVEQRFSAIASSRVR